MNAVFVVLFFILLVRLLKEGFRADKAERSRTTMESIAEQAIAAGEDSNRRLSEIKGQIEAMTKRNFQLQDELLCANQLLAQRINGERYKLILGDPFTWAGGMKEGGKMILEIQAPKILNV